MRAARSIAMTLPLATAILSGCPPRVNDVQLSLGSRGPQALLCRTGLIPLGPRMGPPPDAGADASTFLLDRARAEGSVRVVVDFFDISGGTPGCMPDQLIDHCSRHCCSPLVPNRVCLDVPLGDAGTLGNFALANYVVNALHGRVVTPDAPSGTVIVRVVATTQTCDEVSAVNGSFPGFVTPQLVGCAYSCPGSLSTVEGTLYLGLPALSDQCENVVDACAHQFDALAAASCHGG